MQLENTCLPICALTNRKKHVTLCDNDDYVAEATSLKFVKYLLWAIWTVLSFLSSRVVVLCSRSVSPINIPRTSLALFFKKKNKTENIEEQRHLGENRALFCHVCTGDDTIMSLLKHNQERENGWNFTAHHPDICHTSAAPRSSHVLQTELDWTRPQRAELTQAGTF